MTRTMLYTFLTRKPFHRRTPRTGAPAAAGGHHVLSVELFSGGPEVIWRFDAAVAYTGEAHQGLMVNGENPAAATFTPGDDFVICLYITTPSVGDPWQYTGPAAELVFEDGKPGVPGSGVVEEQ